MPGICIETNSACLPARHWSLSFLPPIKLTVNVTLKKFSWLRRNKHIHIWKPLHKNVMISSTRLNLEGYRFEEKVFCWLNVEYCEERTYRERSQTRQLLGNTFKMADGNTQRSQKLNDEYDYVIGKLAKSAGILHIENMYLVSVLARQDLYSYKLCVWPVGLLYVVKSQ